MIISCPQCDEDDDLRGEQDGESITITCGTCATTWERDLSPVCDRCDGDDMVAAVKAVVEKGRGTQLSVVGTQVVYLCGTCDETLLRKYFDNRPNPLMPDELPTVGPEQA
jgi:hypothetical protein